MRSFWGGDEPGGETEAAEEGSEAAAAEDDAGGLDETREERWPWHRFFYGALVEFLARSGARAVAIDLDLSGAGAYEDMGDSELAASFLRRAPVAYLALNLKRIEAAERGAAGSYLGRILERADRVAARAAIDVREESRLDFESRVWNTAQVPFGPLADPAAIRGLGVVNGTRARGDRIRRALVLVRYRDRLLPSLSLAVARGESGGGEVAVDAEGRLRLGTRRVPLDARGRLLIDWYGGIEAFDSWTIHEAIKIALADLERNPPSGADPESIPPLGWADRIAPEEVEAYRERFRGKIVLIGANAPELGDVYTNPFSEVFPGVGVHATVIGNLLRGEALRRPRPGTRRALLALLALAAGLGAPLVGWERRGVALFALLVAACLAGWVIAWREGLLWLDLLVPLGTLSLAYGSGQVVEYLRTGRRKRQLRATFDRVLHPSLIDQLLERPERLALGGEIRVLTVLFSDLQNSTALSERYAPTEWVERLNRYFSAATEVVLSSDGYLDKYIGDGLMAVWGAPVAHADHARRAVLAALDLRRVLGELQREMTEEQGVELVTRMGMNTAEVLVGMVGGNKMAHYTVMGDGVVVASRLEGANKYYRTGILIGDGTRAAAADAIDAREIDLVVLKGKTRPLRVWEPLARGGELSESAATLRERYAEGLALYRQRQWDAAIEAFARAREIAPGDGPSAVLAERCRRYREEAPGPGWRGEHVLEGK